MAHILILFAHPALEKSRVHRRLVQAIPQLPGITFHDLYEAYPTFDIDVAHEQRLLSEHDLVLLQFPFFWYSTPPLIKQWEDLVLEHGWAYGSQGNALRGKRALCVVSTGGGAAAYQHEGYNRFTMRELLAPLDQTFALCKMTFLPPYLVQGTHRLTEAAIEQEAARYQALLTDLHNDRIDLEAARSHELLNSALETTQSEGVRA